MKSKFITIDGYEKIETVKNPRKAKKASLGKNVKKFFRICFTIASDSVKQSKKAHVAKKQEKNTGSHYGTGKAQAVTVSAKRAKQKTAVYASRTRSASKRLLKSKVVLGTATSCIAVMLCVMTSMSVISIDAFAVEDSAVSTDATQTETAQDTDTAISEDVQDSISQSVSEDEILVDGYGLYIDNSLAGVCVDKQELENELQKILDEYKAKYDDETTDEFANDVQVVAGSYKPSLVTDAESIVSENYDKFSFSLSTDIVYTQKIPYTTKTKYDKTKSESYKAVVQKGISGKQKITYRVTYVDGVQTDACVTDTKTVRKAQKKIIVVGTKKAQTTSTTSSTSTASDYSSSAGTVSASTSSSASGSFMWPVPYTTNITSTYGVRWGSMHSGIDISSSGISGQAIVASDSGTVTWAGYDSSGYGNYVIIDHGNGYQTLYGHCSSLYVSQGQSVSKGQTIAAVGSTGDSTGAHLHFEIRSGSSRLNPLSFL